MPPTTRTGEPLGEPVDREAIREDVYERRAITAQRWHDELDAELPRSVREEALAILETPHGEQLELEL